MKHIFTINQPNIMKKSKIFSLFYCLAFHCLANYCLVFYCKLTLHCFVKVIVKSTGNKLLIIIITYILV